jgi:Tfp pilus assembly protein PilX
MKKGSILISSVIILTTLLAITLGVSSAVLSTNIKTAKAYRSVSALSYAEAGINKALWEINQAASSYTGESNNTELGGGAFDVELSVACGLNCKLIIATGYVPTKANYLAKKTVRVKVKDAPSSTGLAFSYGVQAGPLGITMSNNSSISGVNGSVGNVYSQGTLVGGNNTIVTGDVIMSGGGGKVDTVQVNGNIKAHHVLNSIIGADAYYQTIDNKTKVSGNLCPNSHCHPGSPDQPDVPLPITNQMISEWETTAAAGGTITPPTGTLTLENNPATGEVALGPKKIDGNLEAAIGTRLRITGTLWVTGNINLANNMTIVLDPGYGNMGGLILADSPTEKANRGKISNGNNVKVCGSVSFVDCENNIPHPDNKSSVMFLSTKIGPTISDPAIVASNNSTSVIYYATVGMLEVANNATLKAFTGGGLHLSNGANVIYDQGLASSQFSGGPGGSWVPVEWQIIY